MNKSEEMKKKIFETNENGKTTYKIYGVLYKAILRCMFIVIHAYIRKQKSLINNLNLYIKELGKEKQRKPKVSRRKEFVNIRAEINKTETKETITKINKSKSWFFEKINKIDKL